MQCDVSRLDRAEKQKWCNDGIEIFSSGHVEAPHHPDLTTKDHPPQYPRRKQDVTMGVFRRDGQCKTWRTGEATSDAAKAWVMTEAETR